MNFKKALTGAERYLRNRLDDIEYKKAYEKAAKEEELALQFLDHDIEELEVKEWISVFVREIVESDSPDEINPDHFEVWGKLSEYQQGIAFYYLIGVLADVAGADAF